MGVLDEIKAILSPAAAWLWAELGKMAISLGNIKLIKLKIHKGHNTFLAAKEAQKPTRLFLCD